MVGLELPVLAMEHHYLLTEQMPEVVEWNEKTGKEMIHVIDFKGEIYMRQERDGMLLGTYEQAATPWSPKDTPWDFAQELLEPDLDRISPSLEIGFKHFPAMEKAGIRRIVNGPFTFAPDGNPLIGPVKGVPNFWSACAVMAGFSQGGGVGLALSEWMVNGDPGYDVWGMDVARYGPWATRDYTNAKVRENYSRRFRIRYPNEELPAARPQQTTPLYDLHLANGAVMGDSWGLETPLWFAPEGVEAKDHFSFKRSNDFEHVAAEVRELPHECRRDRHFQLCQIRSHRLRCARMARAHHDQLRTPRRKAGPDLDDQRGRQDHRRLHHRLRGRGRRRRAVPDVGVEPGAALPHALVRAASAGRWLGHHPQSSILASRACPSPGRTPRRCWRN